MCEPSVFESERKFDMRQTLTALILSLQALAAANSVTLRDRAKPYIDSALDAGQPFAVVSGASGMPNVAADSLVAVLGQGLASQTVNGAAPYPTALGGVSIQVVDAAGAVRMAQLLYVSPDQINFLIPPGTAAGTATVSIINGAGSTLASAVQIQAVAPGLFTANENGQGVVSATAYRTVIPTTLAVPVPVYQCVDAPGSCVSVPISLGVDTPVFVTVNATGMRGRSSDAAVQLTIGAQKVAIQAINALDDNGPSAGIDQLIFPIPLSLRGSEEVDIVVTVDGTTSNTARINIM
jgi:uncharacterized protein (TIGR03437 family)